MRANEVIAKFFKMYYEENFLMIRRRYWSNYQFETKICDFANKAYDIKKTPSTFRRVKDDMLRNTKSREVLNREGFDIKAKKKGKYVEYRITRYRGKKYWEQNEAKK
jgi:hypothetical protein